jgi:hypothetical protein
MQRSTLRNSFATRVIAGITFAAVAVSALVALPANGAADAAGNETGPQASRLPSPVAQPTFEPTPVPSGDFVLSGHQVNV